MDKEFGAYHKEGLPAQFISGNLAYIQTALDKLKATKAKKHEELPCLKQENPKQPCYATYGGTTRFGPRMFGESVFYGIIWWGPSPEKLKELAKGGSDG